MKQRCYNTKSTNYERYGARGITVSPAWLNNFQRFVDDMGERPEGYTLDRADNNGEYSADNCKWSSKYEQQGNMRSNNRCVGVKWYKALDKWSVQGTKDGYQEHLGYYIEWFEAVCARKSWENRIGIVRRRLKDGFRNVPQGYQSHL